MSFEALGAIVQHGKKGKPILAVGQPAFVSRQQPKPVLSTEPSDGYAVERPQPRPQHQPKRGGYNGGRGGRGGHHNAAKRVTYSDSFVGEAKAAIEVPVEAPQSGQDAPMFKLLNSSGSDFVLGMSPFGPKMITIDCHVDVSINEGVAYIFSTKIRTVKAFTSRPEFGAFLFSIAMYLEAYRLSQRTEEAAEAAVKVLLSQNAGQDMREHDLLRDFGPVKDVVVRQKDALSISAYAVFMATGGKPLCEGVFPGRFFGAWPDASAGAPDAQETQPQPEEDEFLSQARDEPDQLQGGMRAMTLTPLRAASSAAAAAAAATPGDKADSS